MKFYSKIYKAKVIASVFIIVWLLILVLITINHSLSFVKPSGEIKESYEKYQRENKIRYSYRKLIDNYIK